MNMVHARTALTLAAALAAPALAHEHNHLTVDTASGHPGDPIEIKAGYYIDESAYAINAGRLEENGEIAEYLVEEPLDQPGPLSGWTSGDELLLTSDFFFATGRLDGGSFQWELSSVQSLAGGPGEVAWGTFDINRVFTPLAASTGMTRLDRSFTTPAGDHNEDQGFAFNLPGLYDVTLIVWDGNGLYADSQPVTVRFNVVPAPGTALLLLLPAIPRRRRPASL